MVEKFPDDPLAADAQYQIGYIWLKATRGGSYDPAAAEKARIAFQDFLFRFPKSEKAPQARENLRLLAHREIKGSLDTAKYYDKRKFYRSAFIYYNEVIREQPGSPESAIAKKRIDQLRAKYGDKALQSGAAAYAEEEAKKHPKKPVAQSSTAAGLAPHEGAGASRPESPGNASELAPLPPSADSLPPPAAPDASVPPDLSASPSPTPGASGTP